MPFNLYMTLLQFKKRRRIDENDHELDVSINAALYSATKLVESKTDRVFLPYREIKYFDAPNSPTMDIPDLQSIVTISAYLAPLIEGVGYRKLPYYLTNEITAYSQLQRVNNSYLLNWRALAPTPGITSIHAIAIDGWWGFTSEVPPDIYFATGFIADRMFDSDNQHSADFGGTAVLGESSLGEFIPKRVMDILNNYKRKAVKYGTLEIDGPNPGTQNWFQTQ